MKLLKRYLVGSFIFGIFLLGFVKANPVPPPKGPNAEYTKCIQIENKGEILPGYTSFFVIQSQKIDPQSHYINHIENYYRFAKTDDYDCLSSPIIFINTTTKNIKEINDELRNKNNELSWENFVGKDDFVLKLPHEYAGWYTTQKTRRNYDAKDPLTYFENSIMDIIYKVEPNGNGVKAKKIKEHIPGNSDDIIYDDSPYFYSTDLKTYLSNDKQNTISTIAPKLKNQSYFSTFLKSWIFTIILETIILFFLCKLFYKKDKIKTGKIILTGVLASSITLPILRFVLPHIFHNYTVYAIVGEVFVTFVEVFIIKYLLDINRQKSTIASVVCNLFSVIIGLLL